MSFVIQPSSSNQEPVGILCDVCRESSLPGAPKSDPDKIAHLKTKAVMAGWGLNVDGKGKDMCYPCLREYMATTMKKSEEPKTSKKSKKSK